MNYNYLRYFSVLAELEHYTLAAARLGISQPSLSAAIHHLEEELGDVRLFEKVGRNIRLTEEGRFFREKVDGALSELNSASMTLRDSKSSAPVLIRMGIISGVLSGTVAREIAGYLQQNERIRFRIVESSAEELMDLVRQEKLDMAIVDTTNRDRSLHFRKLGQHDFCVALPEGHPLAQETIVSYQQLAHEPQIVFNQEMKSTFDQWASGNISDEHIVCTVNTARAALELVATGVGICFVTREAAAQHPGVTCLPMKNWHQASYMCILYDKWLEPPVWSFVEHLVKILRQEASAPEL